MFLVCAASLSSFRNLGNNTEGNFCATMSNSDPDDCMWFACNILMSSLIDKNPDLSSSNKSNIMSILSVVSMGVKLHIPNKNSFMSTSPSPPSSNNENSMCVSPVGSIDRISQYVSKSTLQSTLLSCGSCRNFE